MFLHLLRSRSPIDTVMTVGNTIHRYSEVLPTLQIKQHVSSNST